MMFFLLVDREDKIHGHWIVVFFGMNILNMLDVRLS